MQKPMCLLASLLLFAGCGDDDANDGFGSCGVLLDATGEINETILLDINDGCGGGGRDATSVGLGFGLTSAYNVKITLNSVAKGELTVGAPATVSVSKSVDDSTWVTPDGSCTVDLTRNQLERESIAGTTYALEGRGSCDPAQPALEEGDGATNVIVGDFSFASSALWND